MDKNAQKDIEIIVRNFGFDDVNSFIQSLKPSNKSNICTIIADETVHAIPDRLIEGERFVFSRGNLNTKDSDHLIKALEGPVTDLLVLLRSNEWRKIRLIYSGHAIMASLIKYCVYRVSHIETEDVVYFGERGYIELPQFLNDVIRKSSDTLK